MLAGIQVYRVGISVSSVVTLQALYHPPPAIPYPPDTTIPSSMIPTIYWIPSSSPDTTLTSSVVIPISNPEYNFLHTRYNPDTIDGLVGQWMRVYPG